MIVVFPGHANFLRRRCFQRLLLVYFFLYKQNHFFIKEADTFGHIVVLFDFSLTVKAAPHECVIRTSQP